MGGPTVVDVTDWHGLPRRQQSMHLFMLVTSRYASATWPLRDSTCLTARALTLGSPLLANIVNLPVSSTRGSSASQNANTGVLCVSLGNGHCEVH